MTYREAWRLVARRAEHWGRCPARYGDAACNCGLAEALEVLRAPTR